MTLRILLSLALLGIGVTVLSGCENEMGLEDELPQFTSTEGLTRAYYGTPPRRGGYRERNRPDE